MWSALYSLPRDLPLRPHLHWRRDDQLHWERTSQFRKNANGNSWWWILLMMISNVFPKIAHVIREVRQFQQTPYKIDPIQKAAEYLLDPSRRLPDDELYQRSLMIEPRSSRLSVSYPSTSTSALSSFSNQKTGEKWRSSLLPQLSSHFHCSTHSKVLENTFQKNFF